MMVLSLSKINNGIIHVHSNRSEVRFGCVEIRTRATVLDVAVVVMHRVAGSKPYLFFSSSLLLVLASVTSHKKRAFYHRCRVGNWKSQNISPVLDFATNDHHFGLTCSVSGLHEPYFW